MQAIYTSITTIQSSGAASSLVSSTKDSAMVHMSPAEAASGTITTPSFKNHHEIPSSRALPYLTAAHVIESQKSRCSGCNSHQWRCRVSKWSSSEVWISQKLQLASRLCCQACCISSCRTAMSLGCKLVAAIARFSNHKACRMEGEKVELVLRWCLLDKFHTCAFMNLSILLDRARYSPLGWSWPSMGSRLLGPLGLGWEK